MVAAPAKESADFTDYADSARVPGKEPTAGRRPAVARVTSHPEMSNAGIHNVTHFRWLVTRASGLRPLGSGGQCFSHSVHSDSADVFSFCAIRVICACMLFRRELAVDVE